MAGGGESGDMSGAGGDVSCELLGEGFVGGKDTPRPRCGGDGDGWDGRT